MKLRTDVQFVGIPGIFVNHYLKEIDSWLSNFEKRGPLLKLWLRRDPAGEMLIGDGSDAQKMVPIISSVVTLKALKVDAFRRRNLIIIPADDTSGKKIQKHSDDLQELYEPQKDWSIPV